ncbi:MAG TPA: tetratricopeptide repeat protein, partial [bacterium]|nr:tetratricopeptide repeat protein [bacterium]
LLVAFHRSNHRDAFFLLVVLLGMMAAVILFFVHARYRMASIPFVCLFAGMAVQEFIRYLRENNRRRLALSLPVLIGAGFFCNLPRFEHNPLPGYYNLANAYYQSGDLPSAEHWLTYILERSDSEKSRYLLGTIQQQSGRPDAAEDTFRAILRDNPGHYDAALSLGIVLTRQQKPVEAEAIFRQAIEADPKRPEARLNLAVLGLQTGRPDIAAHQIEILQQLPLDPAVKQRVAAVVQMLKEKREDTDTKEQESAGAFGTR